MGESMLGRKRPGFVQRALGAAAVALAAVALGAAPARAFTTETINGDANGSARFSDPNGGGTQLFGPGGPTLHFGAGPGQTVTPFSPYSHMPGAGFGAAPSQPTPDPYNLNNPNRY
jgi:hypothetical protein